MISRSTPGTPPRPRGRQRRERSVSAWMAQQICCRKLKKVKVTRSAPKPMETLGPALTSILSGFVVTISNGHTSSPISRTSCERSWERLVLAIEHVGSTAVPGLSAKPIIDIEVVIASAYQFPPVKDRLERFGYIPLVYWLSQISRIFVPLSLCPL